MQMLKYRHENDIDSPKRTLRHREIILKKPFLKKLYIEWYTVFISEMQSLPTGKCVEIGSGGGFLKDMEPSVITSDILPLPHIDLNFSALNLPFKESELSGLFLLDTFHHISDSYLFLKEANRVLKHGGKLIMIEPANTLWGRIIYKNLHHEPFNENGDWQIPATGPMSGANGALPWIVFHRDIDLFRNRFPDLEIESISYHTPFRYLLSGGVTYKTIFPGWSFGCFKIVDHILSTISKQFSMFMTINISKR